MLRTITSLVFFLLFGATLANMLGATTDEFSAVFRYFRHEILVDPALFSYEVFLHKLALPLFQIMTHFEVGQWQLVSNWNPILTLAATLLTVSGFYLLLSPLCARERWIALALFLVLGPMAHLVYGYHYKAGAGGATIGNLALSLVTLLFGAFVRRRMVVFLIAAMALIIVHPLNAFFALSILGFSFFIFPKDFRQNLSLFFAVLVSGALTLGILFLSARGAGLGWSGDPQVLGQLIQLINGRGAATGYFLPFFSTKNLLTEGFNLTFFIGILFYFLRRPASANFSPPRPLLKLALSCAISAAIAGVGHFIFYRMGWWKGVATDPSRVFAYYRPLQYVFLAQWFWSELHQNRARALGTAALFYGVTSVFAPLQSLVMVGPLASEKHSRFLNGRTLWFLVLGFAGFKSVMSILSFSRGNAWASFQTMQLLILILASAIFFRRRGLKIVASGGIAFFLILGAARATWQKAQENWSLRAEYLKIETFFAGEGNPSAIILTADEKISHALQPRATISAFHNLSYGIYFGDSQKLLREAKLAWGLDFAPAQTAQILRDYEKTGGLTAYLEQKMHTLTKADIARIRKGYPNLEYIIDSPRDGTSALIQDRFLPAFVSRHFRIFRLGKSI